MEKITRPKKIIKSEQSIQTNEFIQKNMQTQINAIYDYLDKIAEKLN